MTLFIVILGVILGTALFFLFKNNVTKNENGESVIGKPITQRGVFYFVLTLSAIAVLLTAIKLMNLFQ